MGPVVERARRHGDIAILLKEVSTVLQGRKIDEVVFAGGYTSSDFAAAKRVLLTRSTCFI